MRIQPNSKWNRTATAITGTILPANVTGLPSGYKLVQTATEIRLDEATATQSPTPAGANESMLVTLTGAPLTADKLFVRVKAQ